MQKLNQSSKMIFPGPKSNLMEPRMPLILHSRTHRGRERRISAGGCKWWQSRKRTGAIREKQGGEASSLDQRLSHLSDTQ